MRPFKDAGDHGVGARTARGLVMLDSVAGIMHIALVVSRLAGFAGVDRGRQA